MFRTFAIPLTWSELVGRTLKETSADNALGLAAQLAFYFLLRSCPPSCAYWRLPAFCPAG